jgi:phage-related baseplate assembly protein
MAYRILPQNTDYTDKDFDSLRTRLFALIRSVFPEWTDDQITNFGNIIVEQFAFVGDVLLYYQDNQARESRIATARLRKSIIGLVKLIGYRPRGTDAATVDLTVTLSAPLAGSLTIPAGHRVKTAEIVSPTYYQFLTDLVFEPGETEKSASVENSALVTSTVISNGLPNQNFRTTSTPYVDSSASAIFTNGAYTEVDNFLSSTAVDRHFVISVDDQERATFRFGNGINGAIPAGTGQLLHKTGGGKLGRVEAGRLRTLERSYTDEFGTAVRVTVTNPSASSGGNDRETNEQIKLLAPESLRVLERAVAREDYEIAAKLVSGVARALFVTSNEYSLPENEGYLFIVPVGGGTPSQALLDAVEAQFVGSAAPYPKVNTLRLSVQGAAYLTVNVSTIIYLRPGHNGPLVAAAIRAALTTFFAIQLEDGTPNTEIDFGYFFQDVNGQPTGELAWSDVFDVVRDVAGVLKVDPGSSGLLLNSARADLTIEPIQFPVLGTVAIVDGATGNSL